MGGGGRVLWVTVKQGRQAGRQPLWIQSIVYLMWAPHQIHQQERNTFIGMDFEGLSVFGGVVVKLIIKLPSRRRRPSWSTTREDHARGRRQKALTW